MHYLRTLRETGCAFILRNEPFKNILGLRFLEKKIKYIKVHPFLISNIKKDRGIIARICR